jgi:primosomal protein N''
MRLKATGKGPHHIVDEDSGAELDEKDWEARHRRWVTRGEDLCERIVFVFRDPAWAGADRRSEIEFAARGLSRERETTHRNGQVFPYAEWYGFAIDARDFERRFRAYAVGDPERLARVRALVEAMVLFYIGRVEDPVVRFV